MKMNNMLYSNIFSLLESKESEIFIKIPTMALKLLRHFGFMLKNLSINFKFFNVIVCAEIEFYLAKYCSKSLIRLSFFCNNSKILFENLYKPLENVKDLKIYINNDQEQLQFNNEYVPNLKYIYIVNHYGNFKFQKCEKIHFENIEYFTIDTSNMRKYPFSFGKLKYLTFRGIEPNEEWCKFVSNIQNLTTLKMFHISTENSNCFRKMSKLQNIQSNIEELHIEVNKYMSPADILCILEQSQNLKTLTLVSDRYGSGDNGYFDELIKKNENILKTITINLSPIWKFYVLNSFRHPLCSSRPYYCYVIKRITK